MRQVCVGAVGVAWWPWWGLPAPSATLRGVTVHHWPRKEIFVFARRAPALLCGLWMCGGAGERPLQLVHHRPRGKRRPPGLQLVRLCALCALLMCFPAPWRVHAGNCESYTCKCSGMVRLPLP